MRTGFATGRGATLTKTPSYRQQAGRRRMAVVGGVLGLALAGGLIGALIHPRTHASDQAATGPFSYFPSE
ncbi:hypothetical protein [Phenylobacterium sp.]|uniref:hypothetical protein n=1 Tax=Phenylobacterium sp. TaxID=1871053 RepID=UPI00120B2BCF|nr:hypothetical protein [Phenylobacterium sp.]THD60409.1 MAG: hypothetical protein E8A49_13260 [Phenylobacterium sp.]